MIIKRLRLNLENYQRINKWDEFPHLCLKHAPENYQNIALDYFNYDGSKINNYLCKECNKK
jgi:hypothetical protein